MPEPLVTVPKALGSGPSHSRAAESLEKNASRSWEDLLRTVRLLWKELLLCTFSAKTPRAAKLSPANPEPGAHSGGSSWMGQGRRQRGPGEALREHPATPPAVPAHPPAGEGARRGWVARSSHCHWQAVTPGKSLLSPGCPTCRGESGRAGPMAWAHQQGQGSSPTPHIG